MLSFNNNHIFTGYLKQLLASVNLPTCKIYTNEFAKYAAKNGREDPRVVESFGTLGIGRPYSNISYLKNNEICNLNYDINTGDSRWCATRPFYYDKDTDVKGITRTLKNLGIFYNTETHEYLGDFLRFVRDYYDVNLMPLYNCFNNKIYPNIDFEIKLEVPKVDLNPAAPLAETPAAPAAEEKVFKSLVFDSTDPNYRIYAFPVKLFAEYTIAIDCNQGIEMFCGLYRNWLDSSKRSEDLFKRTYQKVDKTIFKQPFLYDKLSHKYWTREQELASVEGEESMIALEADNIISRCDLLSREQDLKLFIKVPTSCRSSITVLEGDYRTYNHYKYVPRLEQVEVAPATFQEMVRWDYLNNRSVLNFEDKDKKILNATGFKPIYKLQLLALNTGESYPFSDRLIEYLSGSAITPIDEVSDNIKRAQRVMNNNQHYFKIEGIWENKMQKIAYDYLVNSGPIEFSPLKTYFMGNTETPIRAGSTINKVLIDGEETLIMYGDVVNYQDIAYVWLGKNVGWKKLDESKELSVLTDKRKGIHPKMGYSSKSDMYDVLGYIDRDVEKYYASWKAFDGKAHATENIQNIDIYDGLYDI